MTVQEASRAAKAVSEIRSGRYEAQTPAAFPAPLLLNWTADGTIHIAQGEESSEVHVQANKTAWQVKLPVSDCCQIHRAIPRKGPVCRQHSGNSFGFERVFAHIPSPHTHGQASCAVSWHDLFLAKRLSCDNRYGKPSYSMRFQQAHEPHD